MSEKFSEMAAKYENEDAQRRAKAHVNIERPLWNKRRRHAIATIHRHKRFGKEFAGLADTATLFSCPVSTVERLATSGQLRFGPSPGQEPSLNGRRGRAIRVIQPLSVLEFLGLSEPGNPSLDWLPEIGLRYSREAEKLEAEWTKRGQEFIDFVVDGLRRELAEEERALEQAKHQAEVAAELHLHEPAREPQDAHYLALAERAAQLVGVDVRTYVRQIVIRQAAQDIELLERLSGPHGMRR